MKKNLRFQLSLGNAAIVLATVCAISLSARFFIQRQFDRYIADQQAVHAAALADSIAAQYSEAHGGWNEDYIHGFGMYALNDGYIIKVSDASGDVIWDAENHDMALCHGVMEEIMARMRQQRPGTDVQLVSSRFGLDDGTGVPIGWADIQYYSPNYANEGDFDFLRSLNRILLLTGVAALAGAILLGLWMARRIARPVTAVTRAARDIADGRYDIRVDAAAKSAELTTLTSAINHMAGELNAQEERKRRLTTDVAHELRTPMANISSYLEAMSLGVWEPTPERLEECYRETLRITGIVGQLETLHRSEAPEQPLQIEDVDLLGLCGSVASAFARQLEARGQTCRVAGEELRVSTDPGKLRQILNNLVSNAMRYSPDGTAIEMAVAGKGEEVRIAVTDHGYGIPEAEQALVFERFYRTDQSRSRQTGGAGVGLAIARALAEQLGGRIELESRVNEGSTFTLVLRKS